MISPTNQQLFAEAALAVLGPSGFTQDPDLIRPWLSDWRGRYSGSCLALASPANAEQVSAMVRLCARYGVPIVPQGGNSGLSGGATPDQSGKAIILSLRRMNQIRTVNAAEKHAVCEAGVILENLHVAADAARLRFPLTLGSKGSATIGGLISTNAGGTQVLRHGSMRELLLGIEAVLPDGTAWSSLNPLRKDNRGFDLKQLLIGSEGTLGIVTAATLKLVPAVIDRVVVWAGLNSLQSARSLLGHCETMMGETVESFEVLPRSCLESVMAYMPNTRAPLSDPHPWHALIEFAVDASGSETLSERVEAAIALAVEHGFLTDAAIAASNAQADSLWLIRESISAAERAKGPATHHDVAVPPASMPGFVDCVGPAIENAFPRTRVTAFGHLGDGNIHLHVLAPPGVSRDAWDAGEGRAVSRLVHDLVSEWSGTISAEHGIGQMKCEELERVGDPASIGILRAVKGALDPQWIMNPGKLVRRADDLPVPEPAQVIQNESAA